MFKMKKGQLLSQPFIYIFALILGALILVWGIKTVMDLKDTADQVDLGKFKNDFESKAKALYNSGEGSRNFMRVMLGGDVKFVCFSIPKEEINCQYVDKGEMKVCPSLEALNNKDDEFRLRLENEDKKNMWILPLGVSKFDTFQVDFVRPAGGANPLCYKNGEEIMMENKGSYIELSI